MSKTRMIIYNIFTVAAYFYGIILCTSLILIPVGIYSVVAAHRYSAYADMNDVEFAMNKQMAQAWTIFGCVLYFPLGLFLLIPLAKASNNVVVKQSEPAKTEPQENSEPVEVEIDIPKSMSEKQEKLAKLKRFKENGLITEDEYNQAKSQLEEE